MTKEGKINSHHQKLDEVEILEISKAYNDYFQAYNELCKNLTKSHMSLLKGILSIKLTERDEIKFELFENKRLSLYKLNIEQDNDSIDIDIESIIPEKKSNTNNSNNENSNTLINRKKIKNEKSETTEEKETIKVIDPIKLIHGGFIPLSLRNSQKDSNLTIFSIINVVNKKLKLVKLLNKFEN